MHVSALHVRARGFGALSALHVSGGSLVALHVSGTALTNEGKTPSVDA